MNAEAIRRTTEALRDRLEAALKKASVPGTVFVGPLDDVDAKGAALDLFLYRIVPNANLRNREHRVPSSTSENATIFENSLPLDLYYLLTVGTIQGQGEELPLLWLGHAMQTLQMDPNLTVQGMNETVHVTLEPLTTEEASRIWTLFPAANYRTSIAYLATPVWIDPPQATPLAPPVLEDHLVAGSKIQEVLP